MEKWTMNHRGWNVLKALFNRYDAPGRATLLKFLTPEAQQKLLNHPIESSDLLPLLYQHQDTLERMHYSWLKPLLSQLPETLWPLLINTLSQEQAAGFKSHGFPSIHLSQPVKLFMQNQIYNLLNVDGHLPLDFLPNTKMTPLAALTKQELMNINDFLGLYDLSSEVRRIVNKTFLKNIYTCLSPKQFYFLKSCLHQKEKLVSPPLGIDPSKPNCPKLKQLIHRRGLVRLGKALCGEHKDLIWYLTRTLDIGRGKIILDHYKPEAIPTITSFLQVQVINVMNFLKSE